MTNQFKEQFRKNSEVIDKGWEVRNVHMDKEEEHIVQCPNCGHDFDEMELKPEGVCIGCLLRGDK